METMDGVDRVDGVKCARRELIGNIGARVGDHGPLLRIAGESGGIWGPKLHARQADAAALEGANRSGRM